MGDNNNNNNSVMNTNLLNMTSNIVASYLGNNKLDAMQIGKVINTVYKTLDNVNNNNHRILHSNRKAAVPVKKSITDDYIVCLEDGKKLKMLKRHLRTTYGLSPEEYRIKWGLPNDYPMVAPNYAAQRSDFAKRIGLGKNNINRQH